VPLELLQNEPLRPQQHRPAVLGLGPLPVAQLLQPRDEPRAFHRLGEFGPGRELRLLLGVGERGERHLGLFGPGRRGLRQDRA
jgi:hypothetical protein